MGRREKSGSDKSRLKLEMTPMIDVVFNLLIFFLCSPFRIPEGQLDSFLPAGGKGRPAPEKVLIRIIDTGRAVPEVRIGNRRLPTQDGEPAFYELARILIDRKRAAGEISKEPLPVEIDSDKGVRYRYVVGVLNACTKAEIEEVRFTLPAKPEEPFG